MESILLMSHSILRYILLILLACSLMVAYRGMIQKKIYSQSVQKLHQATRSLLGLQMLLGLTLYFLFGFYHHFGQGGNLPEQIAFFSTGHIIGMVLGITLINPQHFFRTNRQFLVHRNYISSYKTDYTGKLTLAMKMEKPHAIVVSKEKASLFRSWFEP